MTIKIMSMIITSCNDHDDHYHYVYHNYDDDEYDDECNDTSADKRQSA